MGLGHRVHLQPVVLHLADLMPGEAGRVGDGLLQLRLGGAVGDHVEPVAVAAVLCHTTLVGRQQDGAGLGGEALHLYQAQLTRFHVQTGYVVAQVLLVDIADLETLPCLVLHDHLHRSHLGFGVRTQPLYFGSLALRMGQDQNASQSFDALKCERSLLGEFTPPPLPGAP